MKIRRNVIGERTDSTYGTIEFTLTDNELLEAHNEYMNEIANDGNGNETGYAITLTEKEIGLIMYAIESASAHATIQAAQGKRDKEKTRTYTHRLCEVDSKLYQMILKIHGTV